MLQNNWVICNILIITIIVIIILAAIVIFSGLNTPDRANLARFVQSFSDYNTAIMGDFTAKKTKYALEGKARTDAQIYYIIATGNENIVDVNDAPTPVATMEKHYVTDKGEAFVLPGYLISENGTNRWYINERKYYESNEPITGPFAFEISEWKLYTDKLHNTEVEGKLGKTIDKAYIYFTATANGEHADIYYTTMVNEIETTKTLEEEAFEISDNGTYTFTIKATVDGAEKTIPYSVAVTDKFIQMTEEDAFNYSGGTITGLTDKGKELEELNIPSQIGDTKITSIGNKAFQNNTKITSVTMPSSVTRVGDYAFSGCSKLINITIPSGVTSIGTYAFRSCSSLNEVNYDDTKAKWGQITIGTDNDPLTRAKIHCTDGDIN